ncbi:MAG: 23S rRNA (pseudouridine(1915)-N(3))-methyltransferase RlmH [Candidatus Nomurabacteria bacterium]|jgi:23S rRNA (pseudouridine1915-N3)-methyltransferase|nr:23S rRNA (pseudouridine(1915)-N(3))-methyltransferase RlmH [Candidatus Nomurabacteria bacterium]
MLKIIVVGKKTEPFIEAGIENYEKRLGRQFKLNWVVVPNSNKADEAQMILRNLKLDDFVILLDETGKNLSSLELADLLMDKFNGARNIVFVVGGAFGVTDGVKKRADFIWSLSRLVFPHSIAWLILVEQLYRTEKILAKHPYHHF